ncbi:carbohydrate-binding protein [Streptomyces sp. NA02950]|uniref:carbohydrate-binding protein n=1 Tax=Streptomyces sp. NA02950 TaxID=2742137 RepID=UPI001591759B|nr:carbohydrate-binding protein [Streptomyces sp. NA02950]QKV96474.1 carbohydrate-binding protein [Streptomyces sp. NA02950]
MSQLDACEPSAHLTGNPRSDAELIRLVAGGRPPGDTSDKLDDAPSPVLMEEAAEEFRRRHLGAVRSYARVCCRDGSVAEELADEVFEQARHTVRTSREPREAWRHHLLVLGYRTAAAWAATRRRTDVAPDFAAWLDTALAGLSDPAPTARLLENRSLMLRGFRNLPGRTQAVLWHTAVEEDTGAETARLLGVEPQRVPALGKRALRSYRDAYFWAYAAQAAEDDCGRFCGLLDAAARRAGVQHSGDLEGHLAACAQCSRVLNVLVGLGERPAQVLAEGLLPWGGLAYLASRPATGGPGRAEARAATGGPLPRAATVRIGEGSGTGGGAATHSLLTGPDGPTGPDGRGGGVSARRFPVVMALAATLTASAVAATVAVLLASPTGTTDSGARQGASVSLTPPASGQGTPSRPAPDTTPPSRPTHTTAPPRPTGAASHARHTTSPARPSPGTVPATSLIPADAFGAASLGDAAVRPATGDTGPRGANGRQVASLADGAYLRYDHVDFGDGSNQCEARVASDAAGGVSGLVDIHLDTPSSAPIGTFAVDNTGGRTTWRTVPANIARTTGVHTVYLRFSSAAPGRPPFVGLHWFTFPVR